MINILTLIIAVILGIIEGFTEFLPISSTTHLIIADTFFKSNLTNDKFFLTIVQLGSLLALFFYYKKDIFAIFKQTFQLKKEGYIVFFNLLNAFFISAVLGLIIHHYTINDYYIIICALIIVGMLMILISKKENSGMIGELFKLSPVNASIIGAMQALSAIPGVSRLGITVITGLFLNLKKETAIKFSFLLALPTMFAASIYEFGKLILDKQFISQNTAYYSAGFVASFLVSICFIKLLINFLIKCNIKYFGYYRILFALFILIFFSI